MKANDILMTALEIVKLMEARERQLWEEYVEARDANGNLHAVTKTHYYVWLEVNEMLNHITGK
jgi:hydrogenase maturation factor